MRWRWMLISILGITSCGGSGRKTCHSVHGQVFVDGKPAEQLVVFFHPLDPAITERPYAEVDQNGDFSPSTYVSKDGLPEGEYKITFEWLERTGLLKNQLGDRDRLDKRYADPKTSRYTAKIVRGENKLGRFDLTSKGKG